METKTYLWWTRSGTEISRDKLAGLQAYGSRDVTTGVIGSVSSSRVAQTVKNLPAMQETHVQSLGWEDPLEEGMATHSTPLLAWRIPMDRGTWWITVHGITKSQTWLSDFHFFCSKAGLGQDSTPSSHWVKPISPQLPGTTIPWDRDTGTLQRKGSTSSLGREPNTRWPDDWVWNIPPTPTLPHPFPTPSRSPRLPLDLILDWGPLRQKP